MEALAPLVVMSAKASRPIRHPRGSGGPFALAHGCHRRLLDDGRIILLSSIAGIAGNLGQTNYSLTKAGIIGYTHRLADELAGRGVTVNAIAPGFIETDMSEAVRNKAGDMIKKMIPMRRLGHSQDIAKAVVFLASDDAAYITGQTLVVDGGMTA